MGVGMSEFYDKVAALREYRAAAIAALEEIARGPIITQNGANVTEQRRRFYQNVLAKIDALIAAYEGIDAPWA
jgi:hypothetical protein